MINVNCPSCGSTDNELIYDLSNPTVHQGLGLAGIVRKCNKCGLLYKSFHNSAENLYNDNYAQAFLKNGEYSGIHAIDFFAKIILKSYSKVKSKNSQPTLLDIGSGVGIMLDVAKKVG